MREKEVLSVCDSDFIVRLLGTAQDRDSLYLLMEAAMGGELFDRVHSFPDNKVPLAQAKFYTACIVHGLGHLHSVRAACCCFRCVFYVLADAVLLRRCRWASSTGT